MTMEGTRSVSGASPSYSAQSSINTWDDALKAVRVITATERKANVFIEGKSISDSSLTVDDLKKFAEERDLSPYQAYKLILGYVYSRKSEKKVDVSAEVPPKRSKAENAHSGSQAPINPPVDLTSIGVVNYEGEEVQDVNNTDEETAPGPITLSPDQEINVSVPGTIISMEIRYSSADGSHYEGEPVSITPNGEGKYIAPADINYNSNPHLVVMYANLTGEQKEIDFPISQSSEVPPAPEAPEPEAVPIPEVPLEPQPPAETVKKATFSPVGSDNAYASMSATVNYDVLENGSTVVFENITTSSNMHANNLLGIRGLPQGASVTIDGKPVSFRSYNGIPLLELPNEIKSKTSCQMVITAPDETARTITLNLTPRQDIPAAQISGTREEAALNYDVGGKKFSVKIGKLDDHLSSAIGRARIIVDRLDFVKKYPGKFVAGTDGIVYYVFDSEVAMTAKVKGKLVEKKVKQTPVFRTDRMTNADGTPLTAQQAAETLNGLFGIPADKPATLQPTEERRQPAPQRVRSRRHHRGAQRRGNKVHGETSTKPPEVPKKESSHITDAYFGANYPQAIQSYQDGRFRVSLNQLIALRSKLDVKNPKDKSRIETINNRIAMVKKQLAKANKGKKAVPAHGVNKAKPKKDRYIEIIEDGETRRYKI